MSRYFWNYKVAMPRSGISEGLQALSFNHVSTDGLQGSIHEIRQQHPTWAAFEEALKSMDTIEDASKATWMGFENWVEETKKGLKALEVFTEFEMCFRRLSQWD